MFIHTITVYCLLVLPIHMQLLTSQQRQMISLTSLTQHGLRRCKKYCLNFDTPPPTKSHLNHFENSKYNACLNHEYTTNQHMEMVSKVDGERWQLKDKLGVVDIDRAVLPHTLQAEVPKVNHVSVITKPTHQQYTQADTLWWNMNSSNCLRNHGARAKVPNANHLTLYQQLTTYFTTHTLHDTH